MVGMEFCDRVRSRRLELGKSQQQVAIETGLNQSHLSQLETGVVKNPSGMVVAKLARCLEVSTDYLLAVTDDPGCASAA